MTSIFKIQSERTATKESYTLRQAIFAARGYYTFWCQNSNKSHSPIFLSRHLQMDRSPDSDPSDVTLQTQTVIGSLHSIDLPQMM